MIKFNTCLNKIAFLWDDTVNLSDRANFRHKLLLLHPLNILKANENIYIYIICIYIEYEHCPDRTWK